MAAAQKVEAPVTDSYTKYETLGYIEVRDAVLHIDYAYVAWKETSLSDNTWRIRIKGNQTAGASFEPDAIAKQALTTSENGKPYFVWGYSFDPSKEDPRQVEFRVHVTSDGKPNHVEMLVRMRKTELVADEPKSVTFNWPNATSNNSATDNLANNLAGLVANPKVEAPVTDAYTKYETLGYVENRDAVLHIDYAYVAWKETSLSDNTWRVRIKGNQTAGASFEPDAILRQARSTAESGKSHFNWGYSFDPSKEDPRQVEFRVHVTADGKPSQVEMLVILRNPDNSAGPAKSSIFNWPA